MDEIQATEIAKKICHEQGWVYHKSWLTEDRDRYIIQISLYTVFAGRSVLLLGNYQLVKIDKKTKEIIEVSNCKGSR